MSAQLIILKPATGANGQPLAVAETERLALTPVEGMRVKQTDDGMVWAYEGGEWYPAPILDYELSPVSVAAPYPYKSQDNPFGAEGLFVPLSTPSTILPQQKWADYIEDFVGPGFPTPGVGIEDTGVTYISPTVVAQNALAQNCTNSSLSLLLNCTLAAENVDAILAGIDGVVGNTTGSITLQGDNESPTKPDVVELPTGTAFAFGGTYSRTDTDLNGRGVYTGTSTEYPDHLFNIAYDDSQRWQIVDETTSTIVAFSDITNSDMFPWINQYTDGTTGYTATQLENAAKLSLISKGLTVTTN